MDIWSLRLCGALNTFAGINYAFVQWDAYHPPRVGLRFRCFGFLLSGAGAMALYSTRREVHPQVRLMSAALFVWADLAYIAIITKALYDGYDYDTDPLYGPSAIFTTAADLALMSYTAYVAWKEDDRVNWKGKPKSPAFKRLLAEYW